MGADGPRQARCLDTIGWRHRSVVSGRIAKLPGGYVSSMAEIQSTRAGGMLELPVVAEVVEEVDSAYLPRSLYYV